jgi:hypothetical protein
MPENNYQPGLNLQNKIGRDQEKSLKTRKIAVIFLAILGVFFIGASVYQMSSRIKRPFKVSDTVFSVDKDSDEARFLEVLQNRDTDSDGLFDFDEINVYKTSAYLEDTDSDGISDYEEVRGAANNLEGMDPTCPKGTDCYGLISDFTNASSSTETILPEINSNNNTEAKTEEEKLMESLSTGEIDTSILRSMLISNGLNEEEVNQISDEELKAIYLQAVANKTQETSENEESIE